MHALNKHSRSNSAINKQPVPNRVRDGEKDKFWYRSDRFFRAGNLWYFTTREERDVGPFAERPDAEHGLELFIECITKQGATVEHAINIASRGDWSITGFQ